MSLSDRITILYITPLPPPQGGIGSWSQTLVKNGLIEPFAFRIVKTSFGEKRKLFEKTRIFTFNELQRTLRILKDLLKELLKGDIDLVHLNCSLSTTGIFRDWLCSKICRIFKKRVVINYRGNVADFPMKGWKGLLGVAFRNLAKSGDINLVLNDNSHLTLAEFIPEENIVKLPNFIEIIRRNHSFDLDSKKTDNLKVIFVGALSKSKGVARILKLAKKLPKIQFCLVGNPVNDVQEEINEIGCLPNVTLPGELANDKTRELMDGYDVFLFPSSHAEGFPISIAEAMAAGLPVVSSFAGAIPEMIEEGKGGFLFHSEDIEGMVGALRQLQSNPEMRNEMSKFNRAKALSKYEYSVVIKQLCNLYRNILEDAK